MTCLCPPGVSTARGRPEALDWSRVMSAAQDTPNVGAPPSGTPIVGAPPPGAPSAGASQPGVPSAGARDASLAASYMAGDIIAQKYRLTRLLGEGGMGAVWLAHNLKLDVDVAIKLIRRELATPETAERLLQEARAAARIGHRSIVRVFDFGETELDDPFIVMEVLSGESLRDVLDRKGRLAATNAVRILLPIASALVEAHASGIVHRDLKPENVMLVPDNAGSVVPKLVDFGIAKLRGAAGARDDEGGLVVAGTPAYMSPEQAGGREDVDEGADVWALGVMLYEAITGSLPFSGPSGAALVFAIMTATPVSITDQMAGDARLWDILQTALAKQPAGRPTMHALGLALAGWALAQGIDSDVAGTSLSAHWTQSRRNPLSVPPLPDESARPTELPIPKAPLLPATVPPPAPGRSARAKGALAVGGLVAAALLVVAMSSRSSSRPLTVQKPAASTEQPAPPPPPDTASAVPPVTTESATVPPVEAPQPTVGPTASATATRPKSWPGKSPRKSKLQIAKQPDF